MCLTEPSCRRCGLGREALLAMMNYGNCSTHFVEHPDSWLPSVRFPAIFFPLQACIYPCNQPGKLQTRCDMIGNTPKKALQNSLSASIYPWSWFLIIGLPYFLYRPAIVYLFWVLFHHHQGIDYISPTWILGVTCLGVKKYVAKIGCGNEPSLALFRKLGFVEVSLKAFLSYSWQWNQVFLISLCL